MRNSMTSKHPIKPGLLGLLPQCKQGRLFSGVLTVKAQCEVCGLSFSLPGSTDHLGRYVTAFIGVVAVMLACRIQVGYSPSIWTHLSNDLPPILLVCFLPLRPLKGWLITSQIFSKVETGKDQPQARLKNVA